MSTFFIAVGILTAIGGVITISGAVFIGGVLSIGAGCILDAMERQLVLLDKIHQAVFFNHDVTTHS